MTTMPKKSYAEQTGGPETVNHLLNVERSSGRSGKRFTQILIFFALTGLPLMLFFPRWYFWLKDYIGYGGAFWATAIPFVLYALRLGLFLFGNEKARTAHFKAHIESKYDEPENLIAVKTVHEDGCIEYFNGSIAYMVIALNGNVEGTEKFAQVKQYFDAISEYRQTILIQNVVDNTSLERYYAQIKRFEDKSIARDFLEILDYNRKYIGDNSLVVRTIFVVFGRPNDRAAIRGLLADAMPKKAYYTIAVASRNEVLDVLKEDTGVYLDLDAMLVSRVAAGRYYGSRVLSYERSKIAVAAERNKRISVSRPGADKREFIPVWKP
jgi:hypothetical protein